MCTWNCWLPTFAAAPRVIQCSVPQGRLLSTSVFFLGVFFSWLQDLWCSTGGQVTRDSSALFTNTSGWDLTNWTGRNRASWKNHPRWEEKNPNHCLLIYDLGALAYSAVGRHAKDNGKGRGHALHRPQMVFPRLICQWESRNYFKFSVVLSSIVLDVRQWNKNYWLSIGYAHFRSQSQLLICVWWESSAVYNTKKSIKKT